MFKESLLICASTFLFSGVLHAKECKITTDMKTISKSCVASEKASLSSGRKRARCGTMTITAPKGFFFSNESIKIDATFAAGKNHEKWVKPKKLTEQEESDFLIRNAMAKSATGGASCQTRSSAGSNCRVGATLTGVAIKRECIGSKFTL